MRWCRILAIFSVIGLLLAGCGSDDGGDRATDATSDGPPSEGDFCGDLEAYITAGSEMFGALMSEETVPDESQLGAAREVVTALPERAPDEIADDVSTAAAGAQDLLDQLADLDLTDSEEVEAFMAEQFLAGDEDVLAAEDRLDEYAQENCDFDPDELRSVDASALGCSDVDGDAVADAVGAEVVGESTSIGASANLESSLAWSGCSFEMDDGATYTVGVLLDEEGEPSVEPFASLAELETGGSDLAGALEGLGDAAFLDSFDELVVRAGDETLVFAVDGASLDEGDVDLLAEVARGVLAHPQTDLLPRCEAMQGLVPDEWGTPGSVLAGSGGEGDIEFDSCKVSLSAVDGASLSMKVAAGTAWYDERADERESGRDQAPTAVDGVGDEAYALDGRLFVLAGDRAYVIEGTDPDDEPVDRDTLVAVARAVTD